jgi:hypothetical protein
MAKGMDGGLFLDACLFGSCTSPLRINIAGSAVDRHGSKKA